MGVPVGLAVRVLDHVLLGWPVRPQREGLRPTASYPRAPGRAPGADASEPAVRDGGAGRETRRFGDPDANANPGAFVTRHRPVAWLPSLLAVLCAGGLLAGLGSDRVARAIAQSIATERHLRANVVCPSAIVQRKSYAFACLAVYHGGHATFTVTQL